MQLTDLPYTIFLEIFSYASPMDVILCHRLSRDARRAFANSNLAISLILAHFPHSHEARQLQAYIHDGAQDALDVPDHWPGVYVRLARRYFNLPRATPWKTAKISILKDADRFRGVTPWNRLLRLEDRTTPFQYWDPVWTCSPEDSLLVYPAPDGSGYRARDLDTGDEVAVPFEFHAKVIRRVRLCSAVLVVEWCEEKAHHPLNERTAAHRHFATAFDVSRSPAASGKSALDVTLSITFRCEWRIHYLGLPLTPHDRFFSAHNSTHYVVYMWQPTRSPYGEGMPLERLIMWELGPPSSYRPSLDPSGKDTPPEDSCPRIIRRLVNDELRGWCIRQENTPSLRGLELDRTTWDPHAQSACGHVFFTEEENRFSTGPHSRANLPGLHLVKVTGIPLVSEGPRWFDDCVGKHHWSGLEFSRHPLKRRRETRPATVVNKTWPGRAPCWRHDEYPYLTVSAVFDRVAGVVFSARQAFTKEILSVHVQPHSREQSGEDDDMSGSKVCNPLFGTSGDYMTYGRLNGVPAARETETSVIRADGPYGEEVHFPHETWNELLGKGYICGDERWLVGEDIEGRITVLYF